MEQRARVCSGHGSQHGQRGGRVVVAGQPRGGAAVGQVQRGAERVTGAEHRVVQQMSARAAGRRRRAAVGTVRQRSQPLDYRPLALPRRVARTHSLFRLVTSKQKSSVRKQSH